MSTNQADCDLAANALVSTLIEGGYSARQINSAFEKIGYHRAASCVEDEAKFLAARVRRVCNLAAVPIPDGDDAFIASVAGTLLGAVAMNLDSEKSKWLPITSAPQDGTHIFACGGLYDEHTGFNQNPPHVVHWFNDGFYLSHSIGEQMKPYAYAYWKPLGAEPRAAIPKLICERCGADRFKVACPQTPCEMVAVAARASAGEAQS